MGALRTALTNPNPADGAHAVTLITNARKENRSVAIAGGGSDLLGMMKERLVAPDVLVSLKSIKGLDQVTSSSGGGVTIGGLTTLDALSRDPLIRRQFAVLAEVSAVADSGAALEHAEHRVRRFLKWQNHDVFDANRMLPELVAAALRNRAAMDDQAYDQGLRIAG